MISIGIGTMASIVIVGMLIYSAKISQANLAQLHSGQASRRFYDHVAELTHRAKHVVVSADGLTLTLTLEPLVAGGSDFVCSYTFEDDDSDLTTIQDNRIRFTSNSTSLYPEEVVVNGITPSAAGWIFHMDNPQPLVVMSFRIGDPSSDADQISNAITGPGTQGVNVTSRIAPRNLHLWGG